MNKRHRDLYPYPIHFRGILCRGEDGCFVANQDEGTPKVSCQRCLELLAEAPEPKRERKP